MVEHPMQLSNTVAKTATAAVGHATGSSQQMLQLYVQALAFHQSLPRFPAASLRIFND
jgi:hypothetical protein